MCEFGDDCGLCGVDVMVVCLDARLGVGGWILDYGICDFDLMVLIVVDLWFYWIDG